jgi:hypothetical protein
MATKWTPWMVAAVLGLAWCGSLAAVPDKNSALEVRPQDIVHTTFRLSEARAYPAAATAGGKAYIAAGSPLTGEASDGIDIYDPATGKWSTAKLPFPRLTCAVGVGDKVVFPGGLSGLDFHTIFDQVDILDTVTGKLTKGNLSQARSHYGIAAVGSKVYFAGGATQITPAAAGGHSDVMDICDTETGKWSTMKLPRPRALGGMAAVGGKLVLVGGSGPKGPLLVVDIYDTATGKWSVEEISDEHQGMTVVVAGGKALFAGGWSGDQGSPIPSDAVDIFDGQTGRMSSTRLPAARNGIMGTDLGNLALFGGGVGGAQDAEPTALFIYDTKTGKWSTGKLSAWRWGMGCTTVGKTAIFAGGYSPTDVVDMYTAP